MVEIYAKKHTHVKKLEGVVVIKPHGNLVGGEETDELEQLVDTFNEEGVRCLVVNLAAVGTMNSLALSRLVKAHFKFSQRQARVHLCCLVNKIQNVFVITKLSLLFDVYPHEEAAIAGCTRESK